MGYRISPSNTPDELVLVESSVSRNVLGSLLLALGVVAAVFGGLAMLGAGIGGPWTALFGCGAVFVSGGLLALTQFNNPSRLTFDNASHSLLVGARSQATGARTTSLPYSQIQGFSVSRHVSVSNRSRTVQYTCAMIRCNGARWVLCTTSSRQDADRMHQRLVAGVLLGRSPDAKTHPEPPSFLEVSQTPRAIVLRFKGRTSALGNVLILGMLGGFGWVAYGIHGQIGWAISIALTAVFLLGAGVMLVAWVSAVRSAHEIELGSDTFRYRQPGSLFPWTSFEKPLVALDSLLFEFSPDDRSSQLLVLDRQQRGSLTAARDADSGFDAMQVAGLLFGIKRIDLGSMPMDEMLQLEQFLQWMIAQRQQGARASDGVGESRSAPS
jgi:hypothetical protein